MNIGNINVTGLFGKVQSVSSKVGNINEISGKAKSLLGNNNIDIKGIASKFNPGSVSLSNIDGIKDSLENSLNSTMESQMSQLESKYANIDMQSLGSDPSQMEAQMEQLMNADDFSDSFNMDNVESIIGNSLPTELSGISFF